jgi:hypothetical protein
LFTQRVAKNTAIATAINSSRKTRVRTMDNPIVREDPPVEMRG